MSNGGDFERRFEVRIPDGATPTEERRLIEKAGDRELKKMLDDDEGDFFGDAGI